MSGQRLRPARRASVALLAGLLALTGVATTSSSRVGGIPDWVDELSQAAGRASDVDLPPVVEPVSPPPARSEPSQPLRFRYPEPAAWEVSLGDGAARTSVDRPIVVRSPEHQSGQSGGDAVKRLRVEVLGRDAAERVGARGLVFTIDGTEGATPPVQLEIDYSSFAGAYGGGFADRLRVIELPACALASPRPATCRADGTPLAARNDHDGQLLTVDVAAATGDGPTVLAVTGGASGDMGNFAATPLSSTGQWQVAPGSGEFTYGYDIDVPAPAGGKPPSVGVSYSSGAVDGLTNATNTQAPQTGVGWSDFAGAFIERRYEPCVNAERIPSLDLCWTGYNGTISLNGVSGPLAPLDTDYREWKLQNDPGWQIERIGPPGGEEYWKVTANDGTQYFFGLAYHPVTRAMTGGRHWIPVLADTELDPRCPWDATDWVCEHMAWRWDLDYVVDPNGNSTTYYYQEEMNLYRAGRGTFQKNLPYVRSAILDRIEYGGRLGSSAPTAGIVRFGIENRCATMGTPTGCPNPATRDNGAQFPDVPNDLICPHPDDTSCIFSPTFFSSKRYSYVRTEVRVGGQWKIVAQHNLLHGFRIYNGNTGEGKLHLNAVDHFGASQGQYAALPRTSFDYLQLANRVDVSQMSLERMVHWRLNKVVNPFGGVIDVTYGQNRPCPQDYWQEPWHANIRDCFPQSVITDGHRSVGVFNKYLTTLVVESAGHGSPPVTTTYAYRDDPAWAFDYGSFSRDGDRHGWSLWRGYGRVTITQGASMRQVRVFRGMDEDPKWDDSGGGHGCACGERDIWVTSRDGQRFEDDRILAGRTLEEESQGQLGSSPGATLRSTLYTYQLLDLREPIEGQKFGSRWSGLSSTTETVFSAPGTFRKRGGSTRYNTNRQPEATLEAGWLDVTGDERCSITTYADNPDTGMVVYPALNVTVNVTVAGTCPTLAELPSAQQLKVSETYYDGSTALGAAPSRGNPTRQRTKIDATRWSETSTVFDALGRPTQVTDANGARTSTSYQAAQPHLMPTGTVVTNHLGHSVTSTLVPEFGVPLSIVDANGNDTELRYDAFGRLVNVRLPTEQPYTGTEEPSWRFVYHVHPNKAAPPAVQTRQLTSDAMSGPGVVFEDSWVVYDGMLRERQTQTRSPAQGKALVTEKRYDNRGLVAEEIPPQAVAGSPAATILAVGPPANRTRTSYDELGRVTRSEWMRDTTVQSTTSHAYGVDTATVTGPEGNQARTTVDGLGRTARVEEHDGTNWVTSTYVHDLVDNLRSATDPAGNRISYTYNLAGWRETQTDPNRGNAVFRYNTAGLQTSTRDAKGNEVHTVYDVLGRPTQRRAGSPSGPLLASWQYDTTGKKGLLHRETRHDATGDWISEVTGYDGRGRVLGTKTIVPAGLPGLSREYPIGFTYDRADRVTKTTYPAVGSLPAETVTTTYSNLGLATGMTGLEQYVPAVTYDDRSRTMAVALGPLSSGAPQLAKNFAYDADQQLSGIQFYSATATGQPGGIIAEHRLTYDRAGKVRDRITNLNGQRWRDCYTYDRRSRLTEAFSVDAAAASCAAGTRGTGGRPYENRYAYSADGNLVARTEVVNPQLGDMIFYRYPDGGAARPHAPTQVGADTYAWDENGNLVRRTVGGRSETLTWDVERNLSTVDGPGGLTRFVYGADNQRVLRSTPAGRTLYIAGHEVHASTDGTLVSAVRAYSFGGQLIASRTPAGLEYLVTDEAGSVEMSVSAAGVPKGNRTYEPYGQVRSREGAAFATDRGFLGQIEDDTTSLSYLNARYYDTTTGVFLSPDPVIDPARPKTLNAYSYAINNPTTFSDPGGTSPSYTFGLEVANIELRAQNKALLAHIEKLGTHIAELQDIIRQQQNAITELLTHVEALEAIIREQQSIIVRLVAKVNQLVGIVNAQRREINRLRAQVAYQQQIIYQQAYIIGVQNAIITRQAIELGILRSRVSTLEYALTYQRVVTLAGKDNIIYSQAAEIEMLNTVLQDTADLVDHELPTSFDLRATWDGEKFTVEAVDNGGFSLGDVFDFVVSNGGNCLTYGTIGATAGAVGGSFVPVIGTTAGGIGGAVGGCVGAVAFSNWIGSQG